MNNVSFIFGILLIFSTIMLLIGLFMKQTNGLFWARSVYQFKCDQNNPQYENERRIGQQATVLIFKYIPIFFIFCLVMFLLSFCYR